MTLSRKEINQLRKIACFAPVLDALAAGDKIVGGTLRVSVSVGQSVRVMLPRKRSTLVRRLDATVRVAAHFRKVPPAQQPTTQETP